LTTTLRTVIRLSSNRKRGKIPKPKMNKKAKRKKKNSLFKEKDKKCEKILNEK